VRGPRYKKVSGGGGSLYYKYSERGSAISELFGGRNPRFQKCSDGEFALSERLRRQSAVPEMSREGVCGTTKIQKGRIRSI
jgi:hypothetical protein